MTEKKADLSAYNLLIATPMAAGRPEDTYNTSLDMTKQMLRQHGAKVENFKTKFIADIYFARSKLFGFFLRNKEYTHMLMIDDDMGWDPIYVAHMLMLKRDMIAVVGPKKTYPIEYAYNMIGDDGHPTPLYHELETNVAEIPFVGAAFMMISRECAEKMAKEYSELEYDMPDGVVEHAIFDSIILNAHNGTPRRRLAEDYAFCHRWRKIGGKVEILMNATLTHTGGHTFTGNLYEHFLKTEPGFANG